ncbi:MAG TPA: rhomboid family intramembrane serine protease [Pseudonocardiaceae bacterium]|jgi:rhomboid protease GluP
MVLLYVCAAAVVTAGIQVIGAAYPAERSAGPVTPDRLVRVAIAAWRRPAWLTGAFLLVTIVLSILQWPFPAVLHALERDPDAMASGQWWRLVTAQFVQSSGLVQTVVNLPALALVGAVAETVLGRGRWLLVYLASGIAANAVSAVGWAPTGAGTSVFICGLVGALATSYLIGATDWTLPRLLAPLAPLAGIVLCLLANNHGIGLLTGSVLGALLSLRRTPELRTARAR